jgi:putative Mn2+ efflux pump MntP
MAAIVSKLVPVLITASALAVMMVLMMGVGWASGKLIRKIFGIGGK